MPVDLDYIDHSMDEACELATKVAYPKATPNELKIIQALCMNNDLDITLRPYQIVKGDIFLSAAGYQMLAHKTGQLAGIDEVQFHPGDKPEDIPFAATATVHRFRKDSIADYTYTVYSAEYCNTAAHFRYPHMFMSKWAIAMALRLAFTDVIGAMVSAEELQANMKFDNTPAAKPGTVELLNVYQAKGSNLPIVADKGPNRQQSTDKGGLVLGDLRTGEKIEIDDSILEAMKEDKDDDLVKTIDYELTSFLQRAETLRSPEHNVWNLVKQLHENEAIEAMADKPLGG